MNPQRKYSLTHLANKTRDELKVKQIYLGRNGMIGWLEHNSHVLNVLNPLTQGVYELRYAHEKLIHLSVYFPYVVTVHDYKDGDTVTLRITHLEQRNTKSILLEEHNRSIHSLMCGQLGAVLLPSSNTHVLWLSFSEGVKEHSHLEHIPVPVKSLCCIRNNYCLLANQFQGHLFDVDDGKVILKLKLPPHSSAAFTLTKLFDGLVVAATALTICFWPIDTEQSSTISPKSILTETPATCVAFEKNLFVGFAGGMIAMYSMDGTLLQTLLDPQINPIKSSVTEQLKMRIKDILIDSDQLYVSCSSGEVKRFDLRSGASEVVIKKSQNVIISNIGIIKSVKELCVITKSTSQKSDINIYFCRVIHSDISNVTKIKNMGREFRKKISQFSMGDPTIPSYHQDLHPNNEKERLDLLHSLHILDTKAEKKYDKITALCCKIFNVPISMVSLIDQDRAWFKSKCGLEASEVNRKTSFCTKTILDDCVFVVPNALEDPLFKTNPLVVGPPFVRFYAGAPLSYKGHKLGALCLIDHVSRPFSQEEKDNLISIASIVVQHIKDRHKQKSQITEELISYSLQTPLNNAKQCINLLREKNYRIQYDPIFEQLQLSIILSSLAIQDSFHNSKSLYMSSKNPIQEDVSKILVVHLFEDVRCSFVPHSSDYSTLPAFLYCNSQYFKQDFVWKQHSGQMDFPPNNSPDKREINWILDQDCPTNLYSYPVIVLRTLMELIGGASLLSENELEVHFSPARTPTWDSNDKQVDSLEVEITIFGLAIDRYTKKILFQKPYDEKCPFSAIEGKFLLYCYIVQQWIDKLEGNCSIEEIANGISVSVEIPSLVSGLKFSNSPSHKNPITPNSLNKPTKPKKLHWEEADIGFSLPGSSNTSSTSSQLNTSSTSSQLNSPTRPKSIKLNHNESTSKSIKSPQPQSDDNDLSDQFHTNHSSSTSPPSSQPALHTLKSKSQSPRAEIKKKTSKHTKKDKRRRSSLSTSHARPHNDSPSPEDNRSTPRVRSQHKQRPKRHPKSARLSIGDEEITPLKLN